MLIVALVLAVVGLAALVTAVVTSNELIAWVCIVASVIGVLLLIVDALRSKRTGGHQSDESGDVADENDVVYDEDYPEEAPVAADYDDATTDEGAPSDYEASDYEASDHEASDLEAVPHDREEDTPVVSGEQDPHADTASEDPTKR